MHPYTVGLMKSRPVLNETTGRLYSIPGKVPNPINLPDYCFFRNRCEQCVEKCSGTYPGLFQVSDTHKVCCYLWEEAAQNLGGDSDE